MKTTTLSLRGHAVPVYLANTIVVGAGAAGMNAAVHLVEFWRELGVSQPASRVAVITRGRGLGASRMSGSDKQTYYKMGTSPRTPDTAVDFAKTLTAFGACHGDNALVEGITSLREFYHLAQAGVPFPHDPYGAFLGYKTDHDPYERATSAGPKTSKFMSECLDKQAAALGIEVTQGYELVDFVKDGGRIVGAICLDRKALRGPLHGLTLFVAENWVLAAGGPGEIYATTVYPRGQVGIHGPALKAGLEAVNLTESQYGLASTKFRWNVSGTYMQVIPRIYSTDATGGDPCEFLTEYFDDMPTMAANIFLKGYQWPFDAQRIANAGSSLVDMAVHQETVVRGRRVWMDSLRNPVGKKGWAKFRIADLPPEAREYLEKNKALQRLPIDRLAYMNQPAIDIYTEHGIDLTSEPLEIAICAQHHNGGFAVNKWWESNIPHVFVVGEMAGTHGVKRPGGSALNAGQAGGLRAAEYITHVYSSDSPALGQVRKAATVALRQALGQLEGMLSAQDAPRPKDVLAEIGQRMTRYAAHIRSTGTIATALQAAQEQYRSVCADGIAAAKPADLPAAIQARQQCLTQVAMLYAIAQMLQRGAGSRGSHCVLDESGQAMHPLLIDPDTRQPYKVKPENQTLRDHILAVAYREKGELFTCRDERPRPIPDRDIAFELAWREYRENRIYDE